ncbi:hypothetical protein V1527DRAFT_481102 [Lipomyces starkeyi]
MCIREQGRGRTPDPPQYSSIQVENAAVDEADQDFRRQLTERTSVVLETYRILDDDFLPETLLQPSRSFTIVEEGEFVGGDVPANFQEVVLGDCIPDHILSGEAILATPVNFFRRPGSRPCSKAECNGSLCFQHPNGSVTNPYGVGNMQYYWNY